MGKIDEFPLFKTKIEGASEKFDLADSEERGEYFQVKAGPEIELIKNYLRDRTFVAYLLGKKNSGKGTYTKLFIEAVDGQDKVAHISVGDIVRSAAKILEKGSEEKGLIRFLKDNYRGFTSLEETLEAFKSRSTKTLMPTELVLALIKWELGKMEKKTIFLDGFPRDLDQISYSIFFRDLIGYREDPDFFVFISLPESVIDARMQSRVVCPRCHTPRSLSLLPTKEIGYDPSNHSFYLKCDTPECREERMVAKEGDDQGIESIRPRLEVDGLVMDRLLTLEGVPKVYLRNSIPQDKAGAYVDDYEITPVYSYDWDGSRVTTKEAPWMIEDDAGIPSHSLLAPPVTVSLIKQVASILEAWM